MTVRLPVSIIFLFHGLVLGAWATQVPLLRDRLAIAPGALGIALFCISVGAIAIMPFASALAGRLGVSLVLRAGTVLACACFVLAAASPSYRFLCGALLGFGIGYGTVDVAMNACAVQAEQRAGRPILGTVHAMWSVGGFAGSIFGAALLTLVTPVAQAYALAATAACAIILAAGRMAPLHLHEGNAPRGSRSPWGDKRLLGIGALLCIAFAVEGAIADWGGIYLHTVRQVPTAYAALGYSAFALSMVVMRFLGDRLRARVGDALVLAAAFAAAAGAALIVLAPWRGLVLAGFAIVGVGLANVVPALFALAGLRGGTAPGAAVGVAVTLGYAGVLAGPPLFGAVAQATSLAAALSLAAVLCTVIGATGLAWLTPSR